MTTFETKCIECGRLLTVDFDDDSNGFFYCYKCDIYFYINDKGNKIKFDMDVIYW